MSTPSRRSPRPAPLNVALARERTRLRVVASLILCPGDEPLPAELVAARIRRAR